MALIVIQINIGFVCFMTAAFSANKDGISIIYTCMSECSDGATYANSWKVAHKLGRDLCPFSRIQCIYIEWHGQASALVESSIFRRATIVNWDPAWSARKWVSQMITLTNGWSLRTWREFSARLALRSRPPTRRSRWSLKNGFRKRSELNFGRGVVFFNDDNSIGNMSFWIDQKISIASISKVGFKRMNEVNDWEIKFTAFCRDRRF